MGKEQGIIKTYPNISRSLLDSLFIDDFIPTEESQSVGIVLEGLHDAKDAFHVSLVVSGIGISAVQALVADGRVDVKDQVDTGGIEDGDAEIMVGFGVDIVDANSVDLCCVLVKLSARSGGGHGDMSIQNRTEQNIHPIVVGEQHHASRYHHH